jgi:hypothetical protein
LSTDDTRPARSGTAAATGWGEGSCLCGAVRYRIPLPPLWVAHCHCTICRRAQGAPFVTWLGADGAQFAFVGPADALRQHASSPEATRSFCGNCGTPLFFESTRWPGEVHVTLATLEPASAALCRPQAHVHWAEHVPWIVIGDDGLPRKAGTGNSTD